MIVRKLIGVFVPFWLLLLTLGCEEPYEFLYCYGVKDTNLPARLVIVESSANADAYQLPEDEWRIRPSTEIRIEDGRLIASLPSCKNIDGMDSVQELTLSNARSVISPGGPLVYCRYLLFDAMAVGSSLTLVQDSPGLKAAWSFLNNFAWSYIPEAPRVLRNAQAGGTVTLSPVYSSVNGNPVTAEPLSHDELYMTVGARGEPPVIIARQWGFYNTPEAAEAMAYLGIESDDEWVECADYYFGYFAE